MPNHFLTSICLALALVAGLLPSAQAQTKQAQTKPTWTKISRKARQTEQVDPAALMREVRPVTQLGVNIAQPEGELPRDYASRMVETLAAGPDQIVGVERPWPVLEYHWAASGARHFPLRFEEANAERYGYTCSTKLQPAISAAHFFGTIPLLPYQLADQCPRECIYTLGHYRPGSCNPWRLNWPPVTAKSISAEGAAIAGLIFLIP